MTDKDFFDALKESHIGNELVIRLENMVDDIFDARKWPEGATRETAVLAARPIQGLIQKIKVRHVKDKEEESPVESPYS